MKGKAVLTSLLREASVDRQAMTQVADQKKE